MRIKNEWQGNNVIFTKISGELRHVVMLMSASLSAWHFDISLTFRRQCSWQEPNNISRLQIKTFCKIVQETRLKILSLLITVWHHSASLMMPNSYSCDRIVSLYLTTIKQRILHQCSCIIEFIKPSLGKRVCEALPSILPVSPNDFNKFSNTGARMQDSVYHVTLKLHFISKFCTETSWFRH